MLKPSVIAVIVAALIIGCVFAFTSHTRNSFFESLRQESHDGDVERAFSTGIPSVDFDTLHDIGIEVTSSQMIRLTIADLIYGARFLWAPMTMLVCLGIAGVFAQKNRAFK